MIMIPWIILFLIVFYLLTLWNLSILLTTILIMPKYNGKYSLKPLIYCTLQLYHYYLHIYIIIYSIYYDLTLINHLRKN